MVQGAKFCARCGTPAPPAVSPTGGAPSLNSVPSIPSGPVTNSPIAGPAPTQTDLSSSLHLIGKRGFLVQHVVETFGGSYKVLDSGRRFLFTVRADARQRSLSTLLGTLGGGLDTPLGRLMARATDMTYTLVDPKGTPQGAILKQGGPNDSTFVLLDGTGLPKLSVNLRRGALGGITASAQGPDGRTIVTTEGNLVRHTFRAIDAAGREVAKVHQDWAASHETYTVDIVGGADPLAPLVLSIVLDYEKLK